MSIYINKFANNYQRDYLLNFYGESSIYYYDQIIKLLNQNGMSELIEFLDLNTQSFIFEYNKFLFKINSLYINPKLSKYIDNGSIDYLIGDVINQWAKLIHFKNQPEINIRRRIVDFEYFKQDITQAFLESNILTYERYNKKVFPSQVVYSYFFLISKKLFFINHFLSLYSKLKFTKFSIFDAFVFRIDFFTIGSKPYFISYNRPGLEYPKKLFYWGYNIKYDVPMELYKGNVDRVWIDPYTFERFGNVK